MPPLRAAESRADGAPDGPVAAGYAALLLALPYPAALLRGEGAGVAIVSANEDFARSFESMIDESLPTTADGTDLSEWRGRASALFASRRPSDRFDLEFTDMLGFRAYSCSLSWVEDEDGAEEILLFTATDRTSERKAESTLRRELMCDSLTALPNRVGFVEEAERRIDERRTDPAKANVGFAILVIDLMRFSRINESLGALAGDELIITVARRIKSVLRANDVLARIGGNEFAILARTGHGLADVVHIADRVRKALEAPFRLSTYLINIECAIGCAIADQEREIEAEDLLRQSQAAVKRAKSSGQLEVYRAHVLTEALKRFNLENRLREAIDEGALSLAFQPVINMQTGEVKGFEALARWTDEELGVVSPTDFIPVAEESGLIVPLGRWALMESAQSLAAWDRRHGSTLPIMMNVNLSPVQMTRDNVPRAVEEALRYAGIDGRRLAIELTESALISDPDRTRQLLRALQTMDVTVAMDDFGTGFSNLASLQALPIDILKIDRSFVTDMIGDEDKIAIVRAIISLAGALGMRTTAEGIESAAMAQALGALGCDFGQGFYYARPMPIDEAYDFWLARSSAATR